MERMWQVLGWIGLAIGMAACGGGDSSSGDAPAPGTARIGILGGTVTTQGGAAVEVPAGAFDADVTVAITQDGTGAPALPAVAKPASAVYKITPHGGDFRRHVMVSIPFAAEDASDGAQRVMITAEPGEKTWRVLSAATTLDGVMRAPVMQFSYFQIVSLPAVRMPVLQTQIHRLTNASFPGAQQVPAGTEIAGQVPVSAPLLAVPNGYLRGVEAESRLRWEPVYSATPGGTPPRACLPRDYGPAGVRWSGLRDGAAWALSTAHQRLWVPKVFSGAAAWPRTFQEALQASVAFPPPFARGLTDTSDASPLAGFGAAHFYGQDSPRTGTKLEASAGDVSYLPPVGNQAEDDHVSWYGQINLTSADNGRIRLDAVVDTDCGFAVQAAPLSFQLNLTGFTGYLGGVTPRPDVWGSTQVVAPLGQWVDLQFDVNPNQTITSGLNSFQLDPLRWTRFQEVTSISWEFSADGRVWVPRPDLAARVVARPVIRERTDTVLPYVERYVLPLTDLSPQMSGHYRAFACTRWLKKESGEPLSALVEAAAGCGAYGAVTLEVAGTPPTVTRQPQSQTLQVGERATLSVAGDGYAPPTVQWQQLSFADAFLSRPWVNVAGATATSYTTPALTLADHPTYYRALLINASGTVVSDVATISVVEQLAPPVIVGQPGSLNVVVGGTAVFAATVSGAAPFSYQWRRNGVAITGANSPVLTLGGVTALNDGQYTLAVTNRAGTTVSEPAALVVTLGTPVPLPPTLANQPESLTVPEGSAANFAVAVTGTGPYTYAWYRAGTPSPIADTPTLGFASVAAGDAGSYSVRVTNTVGTVLSGTATLTVTPGGGAAVAPAIVTAPASVAVFPGAAARFVVAASGTGPLIYQWRFNGDNVPGATGPVLELPAVSGANAGQYMVEVRNGAGAALSSAGQLIVIGAPAIVTQPGPKSAVEGATATFEVAATGDLLRFQWARNGVAIDGATAASYTTPALSFADNGAVYSVIVYNGAGLVISGGAVLTVTPTPTPPGLVLFAGAFGETNNSSSGDGAGTAARFNEPRSLVADTLGNLYVANRNGGFVSKVTPGAVVTRIAEHGFSGALALGGDGSLLSMQVAGGTQANLRVLAPLQAGAATQARNCGSPICGGTISPNRPFAAIASDGTVYTAWQDANFISVTSGPLSESSPPIAFFAGTSDLLNRPAGWVDGSGLDARFNAPSAIVIGPDGNLYVADTGNHVIRRITPQGVVSTFAGTGTVAGAADGPLLSASFNRPLNLGFDSEGALWVQEIGPPNAPRTSLRKIAGGQVSTPVADLQAEIDTVAGGPASSAVVNGFTRTYGGMAVLGPKRLAFTVTHALLVLTLP